MNEPVDGSFMAICTLTYINIYSESARTGAPVLVPDFSEALLKIQEFFCSSEQWCSKFKFRLYQAFHCCITLGVEVAAFTSKYVCSGRKFKILVYFS